MTAPARKSTGTSPYTGVAIGGVVLVALGAALWMKFGSLVWFDTIAAAFVGCFI